MPRELVLSCLLLSAMAAVSQSQDVTDPRTTPTRKDWLTDRAGELAAYTAYLESTTAARLILEPQPLLDWSNPERGTLFGATFLWTVQGRPALIADAYGRGEYLRQEFQSISDQPIVVKRGESVVHRFHPGIEWRDLADSTQPAESLPLRLVQMRRLAQRFQATVLTESPLGELEPSSLRLLSQPVYRPSNTASAQVAIFQFVQGTDPECALLLEVTLQKTWRYALVRQTMASLKVELDSHIVLDLPRFRQALAEADSPFFFYIPPEAGTVP
jgi:hypothetical protein